MPATTTIATTRIRLKGFVKADTNSQFEGRLDSGRYVVEEYLENHPDNTTDFARVQAPTLGAGDTWICTRWKDQVYAVIEDVTLPPVARQTFEDDVKAIPEAALLRRLEAFTDFSYDLDDARYPYPLKGINVPQAPPSTNNCCTFVEALLVKAWADQFDEYQWDSSKHRQMMIMSSDDFFSPVTAAVESGMAVAVLDPDAPPHPWTIIQGWRHQWRSGHTFVIVDHHDETDRILTLESNSGYKLNGVGFRAIGNLRDVGGAPPDQWWNDNSLWTWQRICSTYRFRQQAWLKVTGRKWSGLD
jgi:hypothetical protein